MTQTASEYRASVAAQMSEKDLQSRVEQIAGVTGWLFYHTHRSDRSPAGFPDCVMVRRGRLIFAELKRQTQSAQPTPAQRQWLIRLAEVPAGIERHWPAVTANPVEVFLWRPADLLDGTIQAALT